MEQCIEIFLKSEFLKNEYEKKHSFFRTFCIEKNSMSLFVEILPRRYFIMCVVVIYDANNVGISISHHGVTQKKFEKIKKLSFEDYILLIKKSLIKATNNFGTDRTGIDVSFRFSNLLLNQNPYKSNLDIQYNDETFRQLTEARKNKNRKSGFMQSMEWDKNIKK